MGMLILPTTVITFDCDIDNSDINVAVSNPILPSSSLPPSPPPSPGPKRQSKCRRALSAITPKSPFRRDSFPFLRRRAHTVHGQPAASGGQAQPDTVLLERAQTYPSSRHRHKDRTKSDRSLLARVFTQTTRRRREKYQSTGIRSPSVLDRLYNWNGDAPASPANKQNCEEDSLIDTAVRRIREVKESVEVKAREITDSLLIDIDEQRISQTEACNCASLNFINAFKRYPLGNLDDAICSFLVLRNFVLAGMIISREFLRAARRLRDEGHHDAYALLLRLITGDEQIKFTGAEFGELAGIT